MVNFRSGVSDATLVERGFKTVLSFKLLFAIVETLSGLLLFLFNNATIHRLINVLTVGELMEDPHSFVARHLVQLGQVITLSGQRMASLYLLLHGILKLVTLLLLFRKKRWAYPLSILLFIGFIGYQIREFLATHHISMIALTLFDLLMIVLTYLEYKELKKRFELKS